MALAGLTAWLALGAGGRAWAWSSPNEALDEFLRYELNGGRLTGEHWNDYVTKYIHAPAGYNEPGWDEVTVVETYKVGRMQCESVSKCRAAVTFVLAPTPALSNASRHAAEHPQGGTEETSYELRRTDDGWRVEPSFGAPRIYLSVYRKRVLSK